MYYNEVEVINLNNKKEVEEVKAFLNKNNLDFDKNVDYTVVIRENNEIKATCSKSGEVLKCFAISEELRGNGISEKLITELNNKLFEEGIYHSFIFTKPENVDIFMGLNYKLICKVEKVALLENGIGSIDSYIKGIQKKYDLHCNKQRAALVMNCNPFTNGHRYLIEEASKHNEEVLIFVVEEEKSLFPFEVRYNLVKYGVMDLLNVKVIEGGPYIISSATFPTYFLREEGAISKAYTQLDSEIFLKYFCGPLNINVRYVGDEPYCNVTRSYNETLMETFKRYNKKLIVIGRKEFSNRAISASMVRKYIKNGNINDIEALVPKTTYDFLKSPKGEIIIDNIKKSNSPH